MNKKVIISLFVPVFFAVVFFLGGSQSVFADTTTTTRSAWCEIHGNDMIKLTGTVKVTVNPGLRTVKTGGTGAQGICKFIFGIFGRF